MAKSGHEKGAPGGAPKDLGFGGSLRSLFLFLAGELGDAISHLSHWCHFVYKMPRRSLNARRYALEGFGGIFVLVTA